MMSFLQRFQNEIYSTRTSQIMVMMCAGLLMVAIVYSSIRVYHDSLFSRENSARWQESVGESDVNEKPPLLSALHLFGAADEVLPISELQLHVVGIVKSTTGHLSKVILAEGNAPGKVYRAGDHLASGVTVYEITDSGVVLENGGRLEKLTLVRPTLLMRNS